MKELKISPNKSIYVLQRRVCLGRLKFVQINACKKKHGNGNDNEKA